MKMESMLITDAAKYSSKGIIEVLVGYEGDKLNLLSRYEISLERILFRSLAELRLLQAPRQLKDGEKIGFVPQNLPEEIMAENVI